MLQLLILILLVYLGAQADRLRWQAFGLIAVGSLVACLFQSIRTMEGRNALGEDGSALFAPQVFLGNWAIGLVLWSIAYLAGFGVARLFRRRGPPSE